MKKYCDRVALLDKRIYILNFELHLRINILSKLIDDIHIYFKNAKSVT